MTTEEKARSRVVKRQWQILRSVQESGLKTVADLSRQFQYNRKTIRRDIVAMIDAGLPVRYDDGYVFSVLVNAPNSTIQKENTMTKSTNKLTPRVKTVVCEYCSTELSSQGRGPHYKMHERHGDKKNAVGAIPQPPRPRTETEAYKSRKKGKSLQLESIILAEPSYIHNTQDNVKATLSISTVGSNDVAFVDCPHCEGVLILGKEAVDHVHDLRSFLRSLTTKGREKENRRSSYATEEYHDVDPNILPPSSEDIS